MYGVGMPSVDALAHDWLTTAVPSWMTVTRGAGSWSRQTGPAVNGTTFIATGTAQNTGRFDYGDTVGRSMLLIEPTRTNRLVHSDFVDAGANDIPDGWTDNSGGAGAGTQYNTVAGAPHGGISLQRENVAGIGGVRELNSFDSAAQHYCSMWVRRITATGTHHVWTIDAGAPTMDLGAATHDWTRFFLDATGDDVNAGLYMLNWQDDGAVGQAQYALPMIEDGDCATSYIPTDAATAARAAELCAVDASVIGRLSGRVQFLWRPGFGSTTALTVSPCLFAWAAGYELIYDPADDKLKVVVGGVNRASSSALTFSAGDGLRLSVLYSSSGQQLIVTQTTGIDISEDSTAWGDPGALAPYLGSRAASVNCRPGAYGDFLSCAL